MAELKREYVVPLRRKMRTAPRWRRSKKAVSVLKDFMRKHMKTEDVVICSDLNEYMWKCGSRNPPGKVSVVALRTDINGTEKTIVSLADSSIEKQLEAYTGSKPKVATPDESKDKGEVEDAKVKEVDSEDKSEEKKTGGENLEDKISESKDELESKGENEMNVEKNEEENKNDDEKPQRVNQKKSGSEEENKESKEVKEG